MNWNMTHQATYFLLKLISMTSICVVMLGCKRYTDDKEFLGQKIKPAPDGFAVATNSFTASADAVNFTSDSVEFSATFTHEVTWKVRITGLKSGAVKELQGTSIELNRSNAVWTGNSSNVYFFRKGEFAVAEISFIGTDLTLRDTIYVYSPIRYDGKIINGVKYTLIDDFEGNGGVPMTASSRDAFDSPVAMTVDTSIKAQGLKSFRMSGLDVNKNSWSGGVNHNTLTEIQIAGKVPVITDPSRFYINLYVYGSGKPNSAIQIKVYEVDDTTNLKSIPDYVYEQNKNDAWVMDIPVTWTGWKLLSKSYSNFIPAKDPASGGNGNKLREPHKVTAIGVSLLSFPDPGADTEVYIDQVILSEGGVFIP